MLPKWSVTGTLNPVVGPPVAVTPAAPLPVANSAPIPVSAPASAPKQPDAAPGAAPAAPAVWMPPPKPWEPLGASSEN